MSALARRSFRSLANFNYRLWAAGAFVSNIGTWMQRVAQDWLVLTQLTDHSASAVGVVMSLQFGPQLLLLPWTGLAADRLDKRRLLMTTQAVMGVLALALGVLTILRVVRLWHVYLFAFLFGCASAFDAPARQVFVSELVGDAELANAVALNSMSFNSARMIGPAVAGFCIAAVGTGWAFLLNGLSFAAVLGSIRLLRLHELHRFSVKPISMRAGLVGGLQYVWRRADLKATVLMLLLIGTFGLNFPIFISTMAVSVFHVGAGHFGLLTSALAIGTIIGALLAATRDQPRVVHLLVSAAVFGCGSLLAASMPGYWSFAAALVIVGVASMTFINGTNSLMQLSTEPAMRGRVMAIRLAVALGTTPIGAPIVGWIADSLGPRWALGLGGASGLAAALLALRFLRAASERELALSGE